MKLTLSHQAKPSDDVLFQDVGGEAVLLSLSKESYFGLDPVGTRVWSLLNLNSSLQHAFDAMITEFDVAPERLEVDLLTLVEQLADAGLVSVE